ncbi:hypothetical protein H8E77_04165 [bacterium]|nr:hypothetical protein [bacterium]
MARTKINLSTQVEDQLAPANIAQDASNRLVTDSEKSGWSAKADTDNATQSVPGLMSASDKSKLDGVANSANNYSHPANHSLDIITETTTKKILTDTERSKLSGIEASANNYSHPASHAASMITESASLRFVSDTEKADWNAKAETDVATSGANPDISRVTNPSRIQDIIVRFSLLSISYSILNILLGKYLIFPMSICAIITHFRANICEIDGLIRCSLERVVLLPE